MKRTIGIWLAAIFLALALTGCSGQNTQVEVAVGDYLFRVEETVGDAYNVRILCSLRRQDGQDISPEVRLGDLRLFGENFSGGGSLSYTPDPDGKILWIRQTWSGSQPQPSKQRRTAKLINLEADGQTLEGTWTLSYLDSRQAEAVNLPENGWEVQDDLGMAYTLVGGQLSEVGLHLELEGPETSAGAEALPQLTVSIEMVDGTTLELSNEHSSAKESGKKLTWETLLDSSIDPKQARALIIGGTTIAVNG